MRATNLNFQHQVISLIMEYHSRISLENMACLYHFHRYLTLLFQVVNVVQDILLPILLIHQQLRVHRLAHLFHFDFHPIIILYLKTVKKLLVSTILHHEFLLSVHQQLPAPHLQPHLPSHLPSQGS